MSSEIRPEEGYNKLQGGDRKIMEKLYLKDV